MNNGSIRHRSASPSVVVSHTRLRKVPPVRKGVAYNGTRAVGSSPMQVRIKKLADLAIDRFNTGRFNLLQEKKADWERHEKKLFSRAKRRWLYSTGNSDVQGDVGRVRTADVLNSSVDEFSKRAYAPTTFTLTYGV